MVIKSLMQLLSSIPILSRCSKCNMKFHASYFHENVAYMNKKCDAVICERCKRTVATTLLKKEGVKFVLKGVNDDDLH